MKGIPPTRVNIPATVWRQFDMRQAIGNTLTVALSGARTGAVVPPIKYTDYSKLMDSCLANRKTWTQMSEQLLTTENMLAFTQKINDQLKNLIYPLLSPMVVVDDWGACMIDRISSATGWGAEWWVTNATGYPMPHVALSVGASLPTWQLHSPQSNFGKALTRLAFELEAPKLTFEMVPKPQAVAGVEKRDRPLGEPLASTAQIKWFRSFGLLLTWQGPALCARIAAPIIRWIAPVIAARYPREAEAVSYFMNSVDYCASLPLMSILTPVAAINESVSTSSYSGEHRTFLSPFSDVPPEDLVQSLRKYIHECTTPVGMAGNVLGKAPCVGREWEWEDATQEYTSFVELHEKCLSLGEAMDTAKTLAGAFNWKVLSFGEIKLYQDRADFVGTNGIAWTRSPAPVVFGLTPATSLGNVAAYGFGRRFTIDFNLADPIAVSPVPVFGLQTVTRAGGHLGRYVVPAGMWMGETDVAPSAARYLADDPNSKAILGYYRALQHTYVAQYYEARQITGKSSTDGEKDSGLGFFYKTSWDAAARAADAVSASSRWLDGWANGGATVGADDGIYLTRDQGFAHRAVVRTSPPAEYIAYAEDYCKRAVLKQDGHVMYGGDIELTDSGSKVEALVDLVMPPAPKPGHERPQTAVPLDRSEEVKVT